MNVVRGAVDAVLGRGDRQPMREADFHSDTYASNLLGLDRASVVATKLRFHHQQIPKLVVLSQ